jgi:capsular polysaccharide biosynthesis protein
MPAGIRFAPDQITSRPGRLNRRRRLIACVLLVTGMAALTASLVHQRTYTATAEVLLPAAGRERLLATAFAPQPSKHVIAERTARALSQVRTAQQIHSEVEIEGGQASALIRVTDTDDSVAARVASEFARQYATTQVDRSYGAVLRAGRHAGGGSQNLVPNPDFEEGSRGWVRIQSPSPGWGATRRWAASGRASLHAQSNGARTGAATPERVAGIPVEDDAAYMLSAVVRARRLDRARVAYLRLRWSAVSGTLISYSPRLYLRGPGTSRMRYSRPIRSPKDAAYARVELVAEPARGQQADLYLDDVRLEEVGAGSSVPAPGSRAVRVVLAALRSGPLVEPASVPSDPSEPRPRSTLLIALLVGSFVAFAVAALTGRRDAL